MMLTAVFFAFAWLQKPDGLDLDSAPAAVKAYIESERRGLPGRIKLFEGMARQRASRQRLNATERKLQSARIKQARDFLGRLKDPDDFVPPTEAPGGLKVGFCGRIELLIYEGGRQPAATAEVVQIVDERTAIIECGKHWFWLVGISTEKWSDGQRISLSGAWHVSGNHKYETVAGGTKTILVLEPFDEREAIPYLPEKRAKALKSVAGSR